MLFRVCSLYLMFDVTVSGLLAVFFFFLCVLYFLNVAWKHWIHQMHAFQLVLSRFLTVYSNLCELKLSIFIWL